MEKEEKPLIASILSLSSGILLLINELLVGINKGPIILSTFPVSSPEVVMNSTAPFWARISFGFSQWVEGPWIPVMLIFASIIISCSIMLYFKPIKRKTLCFLILLFSIISIPFGGGFIIGSILGVFGGAIGFEWPKPLGNTFFGKILQAAGLDSKFYESLKEDSFALKQAAYAIIFLNLLSGLGCGLYSFSVDKIVNAQSLNVPFRTLLLGEFPLNMDILTPAIINIGLAVLKWIALSLFLYIIGVQVHGRKATFDKIAAAVAFAYVPIGLQFFMPFVLTSRPHLTFTWPFVVFLITNVWMILALVVALRHVLEVSLEKSIGIISLAAAFYLPLNQLFLMRLDVPYSIKFFFQPEPIFLMVIACLVVLATLLGVFTKR
jgi:hypothetical protein